MGTFFLVNRGTTPRYFLQCFIRMRASFLLSPSFITQGRMGVRKIALILMKNSHFDRTPQYNIDMKAKALMGKPIFNRNFCLAGY